MQLSTSWGRGALGAIFILICARANATVTQVDGKILPVSNGATECDGAGGDSIQICFDTAENTPMPTDPLRINVISDANEVPQIFQPRIDGVTVDFRDISEGAGFENSFGWYNVGDDVSTPAGRTSNLHPILGCGTPMALTGTSTTHAGNTAYYVVNAEPGSMAMVNFKQEGIDGRYKGGFIGFYLITPEDPNNAGHGYTGRKNCGDFKDDPAPNPDLTLFGRIYFTQKDLNNDGDFVHHLVYSSKKTANRFYFGFEDLFRGGDNDFEDMLIRADGLTPPCVPTAEVCDGLDNDCDGLVDNADPNLTGTGTTCTCNGVGLVCDNGPRVGECLPGVTACTSGVITCHGTAAPSSEICDGKDNNCNNIIDDSAPPSMIGACDGPDADLCPDGVWVCTAGGTTCNDDATSKVEVCNNIDDNCNGTKDEGDPGGGGACGSAIGRCTQGVNHCVGGAITCQGSIGPIAEICNGIDDDCDGVIDDMPMDVGQQCGATNVGACDYGTTICVSGTLQCGGAVGPSPETCNGIDDDCDGTRDDNVVDAGQACGSSIGECDPGAYACVMGALVCVGGQGMTPEMCDGKDNNCNGIVDDGVPGVGEMCGTGTGPCSDGLTACISGSIQCVGGQSTGTETCNNIDDDCDGLIDEGDLCNGGTCDHGVCASPCVMTEFPCPSGKRCVNQYCVDDPCFGVNCPADAQGNLQTCADGACVAVCPTISCPTDYVCRGSDGACVKDTCEYLPKCAANELCVNSNCVADPCSGVSCDAGKFCREGACVGSCQGVSCGTGNVCRDGTCQATGCDKGCVPGEVCNPDTKRCQPDVCDRSLQCPPTQSCDPLSGSCVMDPCNGVVCPDNQVCSAGQCGVGTTGALVTTGGGGGCDTTGSGGESTLVVIGLALAVLLLRRRGARSWATRRAASFVLVGVASTAIASCDINKYCIGCETADGEDGGMGSNGDGGMGSGDGSVACDPQAMHPETCNHADDDCDGNIDETFNLQDDERNCGACGNECNKPGAQTMCIAGACTITACFPGFNDRNGDIGAYPTSDGCEYMCFQSNGGVEACDTLDNDCDGMTDEGFDVSDDINNCGQCQRKCEFFEASPTCSSAMCSFDAATDCTTGYVDADGLQADGCEYQCTQSNGGVEACDVKDNDCDGRVDETFNFLIDKNNCGRCGNTCAFPHTVPKCFMAMCTFDRATDCVAGFYDVNNNMTDGCEYACTKTNGGVEKCDGIDNDCDGVADDAPVDAGGACASTGTAIGACVANGTRTCANGVLTCSGATLATAESCNNIDDDCDGTKDESVTKACYTGTAGTSGIGRCMNGIQTCAVGAFGTCTGQVTPAPMETCNNIDDDCDNRVDEAAGGGVLTAACYSPTDQTTAGRGTCKKGTATCAFGALGTCTGEVTPKPEICGDNLNTDCDTLDDTGEGCQVTEDEVRIDELTAGSAHSYDVQLVHGGANRVYAVWSQLVAGQTEVYVKRSDTGGLTWNPLVNATSGVATDAVKPLLVVYANGVPAATAKDKLMIVYQTVTSGGVRDIRVQTSIDNGTTFGTISGALDAAGDSFHHSVAINGNSVVIAWEQLDTTTLNRDVYSTSSTNFGGTFATASKINASTGTRFAGRPQVAVSGTHVVWAWREQTSGKNTRDIYTASAATIASVPTTNVRVDGDAADNRDADFPKIVANESNVYLTWQDTSTVANGGSDVMFARSTNFGVGWGSEVIIDDPAAEVSSSFTPSIAIDPRAAGVADDVVALTWEDRRQGTQAYARVSLDGGATFDAPIRASNFQSDAQPGTTTLPVIAASGAGTLTIAYQNKPVATVGIPFPKTHVFLATSIDNGATWTYTADQLDDGVGDAIIPAIVASTISGGLGALVAWVDFRTNGTNGDIYTAASH